MSQGSVLISQGSLHILPCSCLSLQGHWLVILGSVHGLQGSSLSLQAFAHFIGLFARDLCTFRRTFCTRLGLAHVTGLCSHLTGLFAYSAVLFSHFSGPPAADRHYCESECVESAQTHTHKHDRYTQLQRLFFGSLIALCHHDHTREILGKLYNTFFHDH